MKIYTIGHSTHTMEDFLEMLQMFRVEILVDIRSFPGSKYMPHFNKENLQKFLLENQVEYFHFRELGGRRRKLPNADEVLVAGWTHAAFKNYAAYTLTDEFEKALNQLIEIANKKVVCIMCAESVPWRCHRLIVSNALLFKGVEVFHIIGKNKVEKHEVGKYGAKPEFDGCKVIYPK